MEKIFRALLFLILIVIVVKNLDKILAIGNAFFSFLYNLFV